MRAEIRVLSAILSVERVLLWSGMLVLCVYYLLGRLCGAGIIAKIYSSQAVMGQPPKGDAIRYVQNDTHATPRIEGPLSHLRIE